LAPTIEIDDETFEFLKQNAEPLVDSPSSVLRRLLGLGPMSELDRTQAPERRAPRPAIRKSSRRSRRARSGSILPEGEYELPILQVLERHGGRAPSREVVADVGEMVEPRLTDVDREPLSSGGLRWENRVHFTRLRLVEQGLLKSGSPRGLWEISEAGAARARKGK
jgi:Mrr restriction endonuclease-like protein/SeqA-like protein